MTHASQENNQMTHVYHITCTHSMQRLSFVSSTFWPHAGYFLVSSSFISSWPHATLDSVQIIFGTLSLFGALSLFGVYTGCLHFCNVRTPPVRDNVSMID